MKFLFKTAIALSISLFTTSQVHSQDVTLNDNDVVFIVDVAEMDAEQVERISATKHTLVLSSNSEKLILRSTADASSSARTKLFLAVNDKKLIKELTGAEFKK